MSQEVNIMDYAENKQELVRRAHWHREHDKIVQGDYYDEDTKEGCCVGCLAQTSDEPHEQLSEMTGAPEWLFNLADELHERLSQEDSKDWVVDFAEALALTPSDDKFWKDTEYHWKIIITNECLRNKDVWFKEDKDDAYASQVVEVLELIKKYSEQEIAGKEVDWSAVESAAWSAAWSAARSAKSTTLSASEYAARSAWSAARSERSDTGYTSQYARSAVRFVARPATQSTSRSVYSAARYASYKRMSEELLKTLRREEVQD